jgi:hypothetical protein
MRQAAAPAKHGTRARSGAHRLDDAGDAEPVDHLHQVIAGDAVGRGDLADRRQPLVPKAEVHESPQGIVRLDGQVHRHLAGSPF